MRRCHPHLLHTLISTTLGVESCSTDRDSVIAGNNSTGLEQDTCTLGQVKGSPGPVYV